MGERKLVTIRTIDEITPIDGADRIECAHVGGWKVVVGKGEFYQGQNVFYFEIDSMLPLKRDVFSFLEPRGKVLNKEDNEFYHRLKTVRLRGQYSQGLLLPLTIVTALEEQDSIDDLVSEVNERNDGDWAEYFGVIKYEPPIPAELRGNVKGWPNDVVKTDETRVQNFDDNELQAIIEDKDNWLAFEKIDGTSFTVFARQKDEGGLAYGVCSRNWGLEENNDNAYWKIAKTPMIDLGGSELVSPWEYVLLLATTRKLVVLQGEMFGENIQNNPLKIKGNKLAIFNLVIDGEVIPFDTIVAERSELLPLWCPLHELKLADNRDDMLRQVDGLKTRVQGADKNALIEGIVWRHKSKSTILVDTTPMRASFKVISNKYLLKHED